jgi:hypothetical protein
MTKIKFRGDTYVGTAEGDHGVFTHSDGRVYAGSIAKRAACVGVATYTDGSTHFVECDANGKEHGRRLEFYATGHTWYRLYEHGESKEWALLRADGTCAYNGKACRADFAPFVALQAMVVPIKARPPLVSPQPPLLMPHFLSPPTAPQVGPSAIVLAIAGAGDDPRRQGARPPPPPSACTARATQPTAPAEQMHRASNRDDAPGRKGALRMRHKPRA